MDKGSFGLGAFLSGVCIMLIMVCIWNHDVNETRKIIRQEAVDRGVAEWFIDEDLEVKFRWLTSPEGE
jgi:hypothetical protein